MRRKSLLIRGLSLIFLCMSQIAFAQSQDAPTLRLMTYNIQHGAGMDDVVDLDRQAAIISNAQPDFVGLQEVDSVVKRSGYIDEAAALGKKLGMHAVFGPAIPLSRGKYGVAVLSKKTPLSVRNIPLPGAEKRTLLVCEFEDCVFATTHLDLEEANRLASLPIILEEAARWEKPFFICGDWNDKPSSQLITQIKRNFRVLNFINDSNTNYTFPAGTPKSIIDYIASTKYFVKKVNSSKVLKEPQASDHRPVVVEVTLDQDYITRVQSAPSACNEGRGNGCFDLAGRRMEEAPQKGIYIQNRKKVAVK